LRVRKDGSRFLANVVIDALKDEGGQLIGFAKITRDVSERVQAARELERLNRELQKRAAELEASNKELESFAYSVSHDLRAPLRHVAGYSELLQKQASSSLDDKSRRYVQTILESAKRMGNLIDDLLAFSRLGRAEAKMRAVDLQQVVKEVIAEVSRDTGDRDIAWKVGALPTCHGDSSMLKLVVVNLVSNAVKFTRMRTRAEIEIGCVDKDNDELEVFVRDNGAGFDMQYANKLFGVFQRLHLAEQFEGTGIGLATVQRIIHRHGGQVRAEGAVDQGATFYFSLPKAHDLAERTASTT
jgi:light-regulated signal transduction histidine kinase (bacteriophytochrome)